MLVEQAIAQLLNDSTGVQALADDRIFSPIIKPGMNTYPAVAVRTSSRRHEEVLDGPAGLRTTTFQTYSVSKHDFSAAKLLDEAIRQTLHGYRGTVTSDDSPSESINIQGIFAGSSFDGYDETTQTYQVVSLYEVTAGEVVPTF